MHSPCNCFGFQRRKHHWLSLKVFHKLSDVLDTLCSYIIVVMPRRHGHHHRRPDRLPYGIHRTLLGEEATRYLLVWSSFLGASCVYKHSGHISITFVQDMVPAALSKVLKLLVHVVCTVLFVVVIIYGMKILRKTGKPAVRSDASSHEIYLPLHSGRMRIHARPHAVDAVLGLLFGKEEA